VKVYLLLANQERHFFYADVSEADDAREEDSPGTGIRRWFHQRWERFRTAFYGADAGMAFQARRCWDWLHRLTRPDESMLVRLRSTRRIDLYHPASRSTETVTTIWHDYLSRSWRRHIASLGFNAAIAPLAFLLFVLPGPNVIGFWFAYRVVHHWLIIRGIRRVRSGQVPTFYHAESTLDLPVERDQDGKARHAAITGRGHRLDEYLGRVPRNLATRDTHARPAEPFGESAAPGQDEEMNPLDTTR
jgi:hypothetical protein